MKKSFLTLLAVIMPILNVILQILYVIACGWFLLYYGVIALTIGIFVFPLALIACPILEIIKWKTCVILVIGIFVLLNWGLIFLLGKWSEEC